MRRRTTARLLLPATLLAGLVGFTPGASAAPVGSDDGDPARAGSVLSFDMGVSDDLAAAARRTSERRAVLDYWTPERMAAAEPVRLPGYTEDALRRAASQVRTAPSTRVAGPAPAAAPFSKVAGKVFFSNSQGDFICSAAAINSRTKDMVSTAGHCAHSGGRGGELASNWIFVPGYKSGRAPQGAYPATEAWLTRAWVKNGGNATGFNSDFAFMRLAKNDDGKKVVNVVGGNGLTVGGPFALRLRIFGYPGNIQQGEVQKTCAKKTTKLRFGRFDFRRISGCRFGGGSSGGPWVSGYKAKQDVGQLRGITSFGPTNNAFLGSPYFDKRVKSLYDQAVAGG